MASLTVELPAPKRFLLQTVALSHGWYDLPPFRWDAAAKVLHGAGWIKATPISFQISQPKARRLLVLTDKRGRWTDANHEEVAGLVQQMLGLSLDVEEFYRLGGPDYSWAEKIGAGRMLRAASVYEDAVKMLATTNCSWSLTRLMIGRLIEAIGPPAPNGSRVFPTPAAMAELPLSFYESTMRSGYRARYFRDFAIEVASKKIDPESWARHSGSTAELAKQMSAVRGFGRYTVENLCKLLGRYDGLGLDSWCLAKFPKVFGPVRGDVTKAIQKRYAPFGRWQGLALWLDLTKDWHDNGIGFGD
jgi:N-glycosylase/DNA lyase